MEGYAVVMGPKLFIVSQGFQPAHAAPHKSRRPTPSGVFAGGTLKGLFHDSNVPLPWEQRVSFSKDIAAGMAYLH
ncbi:hypothetical protein OUZ56_018803 [Daphnia magna]|uniref:Protein kinase domain-containing protein n=1 Tax=Daphnia magna TaxID=35525 RepID=A0ABQ9Z9U3_9CRUS|nr:hypothetical protein OUZ56_018803 [Daphnia magna]